MFPTSQTKIEDLKANSSCFNGTSPKIFARGIQCDQQEKIKSHQIKIVNNSFIDIDSDCTSG